MSEPKLISPLLDGYAMGGAISTHDGVSCYPAMRENSDEKFIVKIISIPASQVKLEALLLTGAYPDAEAARKYFEDLVNDVENEAQVLRHLSKLEGFLPYNDYQVVPMEDGVGYLVYLVSPYKRSLAKQFTSSSMTHLNALNLGIDLCAAMSLCRQVGCLYVDLKPENIFISDDGRYRVGDLGFIPKSSLKYASLPDKYRSSWTAPEIRDALSTLNTTVDIYAIGLILYQVYNGGELPFTGEAPAEALPPPLYADYEMAEIILKACAPNPEDRWADPKQMGQALVSYMQRNGANDTPIVPPAVVVSDPVEPPVEEEPVDPESLDFSAVEPDVAAEQLDPELAESLEQIFSEETHKTESDIPAEDSADQSAAPTEDPDGLPAEDLSFLAGLTSDETAPGETDSIHDGDAVLTDEVSEMLAQADELLAHELPAPPVAPEPVEIPMPEPIVLEPDVAESAAESEPDQAEVEEFFEAAQESADREIPAEAQEDTAEDEEAEDAAESEFLEDDAPKKSHKGLIGWLIALIVIAGLAIGGYYFYNNYYLQNVEHLTLDGAEDALLVHVDSEIDDALLTVYCVDTYGSSIPSDVVDGTASFSDLKPGSMYTVRLEISGFHKLTGMTTASYSTAPETEILSFSAVTGPDDGSVILSFTVDGQESDTWTIAYAAENEEPQSISFTGHLVTITGLTVGAEYTFTIVPSDDMYLVGTTELVYTASAIIYAENLAITACDGGSLTAEWTAPAGSNVTKWDVRCYNDSGYDQTQTVDGFTATFTDVDTSTANTIEVMASGMTQCTRTFITANPITIGTVHASNTNPNVLVLQWDFTGEAPDGGWLLVYTVEGGETEEFIQCDENTASISPAIPGATYQFTIQAASGATIFGGSFTATAPGADNFSGYDVTNEDMVFSMCRTPETENWNQSNLTDEDYTTTFAVGSKASFLVRLMKEYDVSYDEIDTLFVIRDMEGNLVSTAYTTRQWVDMWYRGYCELDIPSLPETAGNYTVEIYFNGEYLTTESFTMQ